MQPSRKITAPLQSRIFRPLLLWFIISVVLLAWRHHQQQERQAAIRFTVSIEGRSGRPFYHAELNRRPFDSGEHSGLGRKALTIRADDAEPFVTNVFVWYGGKSLGNITLARSRGALHLKVFSGAKRLSVTGQETSRSFSNATHELLVLPSGRYSIHAQFARFNIERTVEITAHRTNKIVIDPGLTVLALTSNPTNAEFELNSTRPEGITIRSNTPILLADMPSGEYRLRIWRGDYQKTISLRLNAEAGTNDVSVEFDYAHLAIHSEPPGAEIRNGEKVLGTTPAELTLPTGLYRLSVSKPGFTPSNLSLTLRANEQPQVVVSLLSVAYVEAMQQARDKASGFLADLDRALAHVNRALEIKPDDDAALSLKRSITFRKHLHNARELQRNRELASALGEAESALKLEPTDADVLALKRELEKEHQSVLQAKAETRRELPKKVFEQTVTRLPHHDLFPSDKMSFAGSLSDARTKIVEALGRNPAWSIRRNDTPEQEVAVIQGEIKGFGSRQNVLMVLGQTADNEVAAYFKLWIYTLGNNIKIGLGGISDESYTPLHLSHANALTALTIERRRTRDLDDFKKRIEAEFR
jgi:hypothetical protein